MIDCERGCEEEITELERDANNREKSAQDRERNLHLQERAVSQREYDYGRLEALHAKLALGNRTCCTS